MSHALATVRHDGRRPSVTPGSGQRKNDKPRSGDRQSVIIGCSSRCSRNLSPLQGWFPENLSYPGADAPGYESDAPSGLSEDQFLVELGRGRELVRYVG